jgi:ABC-2 type transport system ATP-binding protein
MDEAELCDRIALIQEGRILAVNTPEGVVQQFEKPLWAVQSASTYQLIRDLRGSPFTDMVYPFGEFLHLTTNQPLEEQTIRNYLEEKAHKEIDVHPATPTIEDCFIDLMQNQNV